MVKKISVDKLDDKERGYLVGLFTGDGYLNYCKSDRHYRVDFYLNAKKDQAILFYLKRLLSTLGLNPYTVRCRGSTRVSCNSKEFMELIGQEKRRILKSKTVSKEYALGLISGFIDADGNVGKGDIVIVKKDRRTLLFFKRLAEDALKVKTRLWLRIIRFKGVLPIWNLRLSMDFRRLPHNSCKVHAYNERGGYHHSERNKEVAYKG